MVDTDVLSFSDTSQAFETEQSSGAGKNITSNLGGSDKVSVFISM